MVFYSKLIYLCNTFHPFFFPFLTKEQFLHEDGACIYNLSKTKDELK